MVGYLQRWSHMKQIRDLCSGIGLICMLIVLINNLFFALPASVMRLTSLILSICLAMVLFCWYTLWNENRKKKSS